MAGELNFIPVGEAVDEDGIRIINRGRSSGDAAVETLENDAQVLEDERRIRAELDNKAGGGEGFASLPFVPVEGGGGELSFVPLDNEARKNLPDTAKLFNPFGEDIDTGVGLSPEVSATAVGLGSGISRTVRGGKQLLNNLTSDDDTPVTSLSDIFKGNVADEVANNQALFNRLKEDPLVGPYAAGGEIAGVGLDPALLAFPLGKAKSVAQLAKQGAIISGGLGFLGPVEEGGSRLANTGIGAAGGALTFPAIGQLLNRFGRGKFLPFTSKEMPSLDIPDPFSVSQRALPRTVTPRPGPTLFVNPKGVAGTEAEQFAARFARQPADPRAQSADIMPGNLRTPIASPNAAAVRDFQQQGGSTNQIPETSITELLAKRKQGQLGSADVSALSQTAGAAVGGAGGALTAPEGASNQEVAVRALIGAGLGHQFVRQGGKIIGRKFGTQNRVSGINPKSEPVKVVGDVAEPLFIKGISPKINKQIAGLAKEFFTKNPELRDPTRLISDDIQRYVAGGAIPDETLVNHGLTRSGFANIWRKEITEHARALGQLSQVYRQALKNMTPEELGAIKAGGELGPASDYVRPFWKSLTDSWRATLVTQPATAVRNGVTQAGRIGLDVIQAPIDHWLQRLSGRKITTQPLDGLEQVFSLFHKNKAATDQILAAFPSQRDRLFQRYMSDVATVREGTSGSAFWDSVQKGIDVANVLNRGQEFIIRRAIFQATLNQQVRNRGHNLHEIIRGNKLGMLTDADVTTAVNNSLDKTFATTPGHGTISKKLIDAVNAMPGANLAIPFPRFMYNAIKFQYQYSPFGILSYLSKAEREAFAKGDTSRISKAVIGSAMLGGAMMFRNSEHAGEKWYEAVDEEGNVTDLRPFNPFATYLFAADIIKRSREGTLNKLTGNDIAQGFLSTNLRAGTGLFLLDKALNLMSKTADEEDAFNKLKEFGGTTLAGYFTPLKAFRDAYDQITDGESRVRDTRGEPFLGPIKNSIPGLSQTLPEAEIPTRAGPSVFKDPLKRQFTGLSVKTPKNPLEKELDKLGFERREILPRTGEREIDRQYAAALGATLETVLVPMVEHPNFQSLDDNLKGVILSESIKEIRLRVKDQVNEGLPVEDQIKLKLKRQPPRIRTFLRELGIEIQGVPVPP